MSAFSSTSIYAKAESVASRTRSRINALFRSTIPTRWFYPNRFPGTKSSVKRIPKIDTTVKKRRQLKSIIVHDKKQKLQNKLQRKLQDFNQSKTSRGGSSSSSFGKHLAHRGDPNTSGNGSSRIPTTFIEGVRYYPIAKKRASGSKHLRSSKTPKGGSRKTRNRSKSTRSRSKRRARNTRSKSKGRTKRTRPARSSRSTKHKKNSRSQRRSRTSQRRIMHVRKISSGDCEREEKQIIVKSMSDERRMMITPSLNIARNSVKDKEQPNEEDPLNVRKICRTLVRNESNAPLDPRDFGLEKSPVCTGPKTKTKSNKSEMAKKTCDKEPTTKKDDKSRCSKSNHGNASKRLSQTNVQTGLQKKGNQGGNTSTSKLFKVPKPAVSKDRIAKKEASKNDISKPGTSKNDVSKSAVPKTRVVRPGITKGRVSKPKRLSRAKVGRSPKRRYSRK